MANESLVMTAEVRDGFSSNLRKLQSDLKSVAVTGTTSSKAILKDWAGVGNEIKSVSTKISQEFIPAMRLGSLVSLGVGGALVAAASSVKDFAKTASSINSFSKEIQLSQQELVKLKTLGEFIGTDWMNTKQGLRTFQDFMNRLMHDGGRTISELRSTFGVAGDELARKLLNAQSMKEATDIAFEAIRSTANPAKARAIAQAIFGSDDWVRMAKGAASDAMAEVNRANADAIIKAEQTAKEFKRVLLALQVDAENVYNAAMLPLLKVTTELLTKWKQPIENTFKALADDITLVSTALDKILSGNYVDALKQLGKAWWEWHPFSKIPIGGGGTASSTPGSTAIAGKMNSLLGTPDTSPGSPVKTLEKSNEDLSRTNEKLNTSVQKQTSSFEKFLAIIGQGGDTAGLGPGMGGVSAGGGGLGGAGALREFMGGGGGGGGRSIRHGGNAPVGSGGAAVNSWMNFLMKPVAEGGLGRTREQAAGEVASLRGESGSGMEGVSRTWNDPSGSGQPGVSGGVASWRNERFRALQAFAQSKGLDWRSHEAQQGFYRQEMLGSHSGVNARIAAAQTAQEALGIHVRDFERPARADAAIAQRSGYINDLRTRNLSGDQAPANLSGLRVKSGATGGGEVAGGVTDAARWMQTSLPGFNRVTSMNDAFHQRLRRNSAHKGGLAVDATINDPRQSAAAAQQIRDELISKGLDPSEFRVIDEYKRLSRGGTGGHLHTQFNSAEAAERYRKASLLQQQSKAEKAQESKLEANGTVNIHLNDGLREKNAKVDTEGMFRDVKVNRGKPMSTAEDMGPLNRASAGF